MAHSTYGSCHLGSVLRPNYVVLTFGWEKEILVLKNGMMHILSLECCNEENVREGIMKSLANKRSIILLRCTLDQNYHPIGWKIQVNTRVYTT